MAPVSGTLSTNEAAIVVRAAVNGAGIASPISIYSREEGLQMLKQGEIAYKETMLSGCASTTACGVNPIEWLPVECLEKDCRNMVLNPVKFNRVLKAQESRFAYLERSTPESIEFRAERATLNALNKAKSRYFGATT